MNSLKLKMNQLGVDSVTMNHLEVKMNSLMSKMNDLGADSVKNALDDKIPDGLSFFQNIFGFFFNWLDGVFPPGTRMETLKHWILVAAPFAILGLVLFFCLPCLLSLVMGIFGCFFNILRGIWMFFFNIIKGILMFFFNILKGVWRCLCKILCCCCKGGRKMMKAPGRNVRIPRMPFELNPADYFQGLRAGLPLSGPYVA